MKVLNQAEIALVMADLLRGKAEVKYARADNHEGDEYIYLTVKVTDPLKAFAHLFEAALPSSGAGRDELLERGRNATIEECARIADRWGGRFCRDGGC